MKKFYILSCIFLLSSCKPSNKQPSELLIKDSNGVPHISIFKDFTIRKDENYFQPTVEDIELAETLLKNELNKSKSELVQKFHFYNEVETPLPLDNYKRQYYPIVTKSKEKTIYFVGICQELLYLYPAWNEKEIITVGGGNCFFRGVINLNLKKITSLSVNAPM